MKIRFFGQRNQLGFGVHFSEFYDAFSKLEGIGERCVAVDLTRAEDVAAAVSQSTDTDINIWFWRHASRATCRGRHILWSVFESDVLDNRYIEAHKSYAHAIWVPSEWGRQVLIRSGLPEVRIDVVPEGINASKFHPHLRSRRPSGQPFSFLMVGKIEERKAYNTLLSAFSSAFGNSTSVRLILKPDFFVKKGGGREELAALLNQYELKNVIPVWGSLTHRQMFNLYNQADCFVFPSRAEGWGLPLIEALAMGIPCIATNYSGHSEYLSPIKNLYTEISYTRTEIVDPDFFHYWPDLKALGAKWCEPNRDDLERSIRKVHREYTSSSTNALIASKIIRDKFSWESSASIAASALTVRGLI